MGEECSFIGSNGEPEEYWTGGHWAWGAMPFLSKMEKFCVFYFQHDSDEHFKNILRVLACGI